MKRTKRVWTDEVRNLLWAKMKKELTNDPDYLNTQEWYYWAAAYADVVGAKSWMAVSLQVLYGLGKQNYIIKNREQVQIENQLYAQKYGIYNIPFNTKLYKPKKVKV